MDHKLILALIIALVSVLFTSTAYAAPKQTQFQKYVREIFYQKRLKNEASEYALARVSCPARNTTFGRLSYDVLEKAAFAPKKIHPVKGLWIERVHIFICAKTFELDITVIANAEGKIPQFKISPAKTKSKTSPKKEQHIYGDYKWR